MTTPSTRPARRILAVVTVIDTGHGRYHVDVVTANGATRDSATTTRDAMARAAGAIASMADTPDHEAP
jgi:hypothetical protein